jgi:hypothetical protein
MIWSFKRYEYKALVHARTRDAILRELLERMAPDPHGNSDGVYRVSTLYYDTPTLRVRVYGERGNEPDVAAVVELKHRLGRTIQKRRLSLPLSKAYRLCRGQQPSIWRDKRDAAVATEVQSLVESLSLEPSCVIRYVRRALLGVDDDLDLRVTFDQMMECRSPKFGLGVEPRGTLFVPRDWIVLEVKVNHAMPVWIMELLSRHGCKLRGLSKYRLGVAHLSSPEHGLLCG